MLSAILLTVLTGIWTEPHYGNHPQTRVSSEDTTPDWRTAKTIVPRHWTDRDQSDFEEKAHGDPVYIAQKRFGPRGQSTHGYRGNRGYGANRYYYNNQYYNSYYGGYGYPYPYPTPYYYEYQYYTPAQPYYYNYYWYGY